MPQTELPGFDLIASFRHAAEGARSDEEACRR